MKKLIITGGAGGIGGFLTKKLLEENYLVTVIGRNEARFKKLKFNNPNVNFFSLDISSHNDVKLFFNTYSHLNDSLFALINVAGVQPPIGQFYSNDRIKWENNIKINKKSNFKDTSSYKPTGKFIYDKETIKTIQNINI